MAIKCSTTTSHMLYEQLHWLDVPEGNQYKLGVTSVHRCLSPVQGSRVPGRLLYASLRRSQPMSFTVSHSISPDCTTLPTQRCRSSGLLCRRSDGLELVTGQSPWPGAQQQQLQTIAEDEPISSLHSAHSATHSAVEIVHCAINPLLPLTFINKNLALANRSRVSCAHNTLRASTPCSKKHVTTFLMISWSGTVRLQRFLAHFLLSIAVV